jgi:hypothetical protein
MDPLHLETTSSANITAFSRLTNMLCRYCTHNLLRGGEKQGAIKKNILAD